MIERKIIKMELIEITSEKQVNFKCRRILKLCFQSLVKLQSAFNYSFTLSARRFDNIKPSGGKSETIIESTSELDQTLEARAEIEIGSKVAGGTLTARMETTFSGEGKSQKLSKRY